MTLSRYLSKDSITEFIESHAGYLRSQPVILCIVIESYTSQYQIDEIVNEIIEKPPITKDNPCLIFILSENTYIHHDNLMNIPNSTFHVVNEITKGTDLSVLERHFEIVTGEVQSWIEKENIPLVLKEALKFLNEYYEYLHDPAAFCSCGERQYTFSLLKEFTKLQLGYEIKFDDKLNLRLKEWKN
jgi:hypothetical protein